MNLPILALIVASLIWGAAAPIFKWSITNIPIFPLVFIRFFVASVFLIPFLKKTRIERRDLPTIVLLTLFAITFNVAFFFWGISLTSAINAGLMATTAPIFTILAARVFLRERQAPNLIWGAILGLAGVVVIIGQPILTRGISLDLLGNFFLLASIWAAVGHEILVKKLQPKYDTALLTYVMFVLGALTFLPLAYLELSRHPEFLLAIDGRGATGIVYGIFFSSLLAYFFWNWGLSRLPASKVGIFLYADPIAATLIAVPLLHETITPVHLLGALLIFGGIYLAERRIHYHHFKTEDQR